MHLSKALTAALATLVAGAAVAVAVTTAAPAGAAAGTGTGYLHTRGNKIIDSTGGDRAADRPQLVRHGDRQQDVPRPVGRAPRGAATSTRWPRSATTPSACRSPTTRSSPARTATGINDYVNPDLIGLTPLQILDKVIAYAGSKGMRIILDRHRPTAAGQSALWYVSATPESTWINDWKSLAQHYANNPTVIGADLHNEPHADGTDPNAHRLLLGLRRHAPRLAAGRRAGRQRDPGGQPQLADLRRGRQLPERRPANVWDNIPATTRTAAGGAATCRRPASSRYGSTWPTGWSTPPHEYGTSVYHQTWFDDPTYPANLPAIWDNYWGYLYKQNIAPIMIGEFGTTLARPAGQAVAEEAHEVHGHRRQRHVVHLLVVEPELR